jgi:Cu/Ag efflux protein CusF
MKTNLSLCLLLLFPISLFAAEKSADAPKAKATEAVKRYPLKGVVTGILAEKSSLLVKHEDIPGLMRAMTMMFKVDAATLKSAQEGQAITGLVSRQGTTWVLEEVKVVAEKKR